MKKLLKTYNLNSDMQYMEMIAESFINGQYSQAKEQFKAMPKSYRIAMLKSLCSGNWMNGITQDQKDILFDCI